MKTLLILLSLTLLSCSPKTVDWNNLDKMYYFKGNIEQFESKTIENLIKENKFEMFELAKVKKKFSSSEYKGKAERWKGGTNYAIAEFKDGTTIKIELSSNYGVYRILDFNSQYSIKGDTQLRRERWEELLQ
jgi:hypothetical protein